MIFAGNRALETMGFPTFGFAGGRADVWEPDEDVYWGPERAWLGDERHRGVRELEDPWPPTRWASSTSTRRARTPSRTRSVGPGHPRHVPADGDERRGDRRADRRRAHLRQDPRRGRPERYLGPEPEGAPLGQGLGWKSSYGTGKGSDTITSGLDGTWTPTPTRWDNSFFENLFGHEWDVALRPRRSLAVGPEERRRDRHRAGRPRPVEDTPRRS